MKIKNKKMLVVIIVILIGIVGLIGYKLTINNKAVQGMKQYTIIITDTKNTFHDEFTIKTEETSLGKDLDKKDVIELKKEPNNSRRVISVHGKKADEEKEEWWQIILNGESSSTDIDNIMIHDGDEVRFVLTSGL